MLLTDKGGCTLDKDIIKSKKDWLYRYKKNQLKIMQLKNKLSVYDERILKCKTVNYGNTSCKNNRISYDDLLVEKIDLENRIKKLDERGKRYKKEIINAIDNMDDCRYSEILEYWFINMYSPERISQEMGYSTRHIVRLYSEAINRISVSM